MKKLVIRTLEVMIPMTTRFVGEKQDPRHKDWPG
jgi:hypothetical protein